MQAFGATFADRHRFDGSDLGSLESDEEGSGEGDDEEGSEVEEEEEAKADGQSLRSSSIVTLCAFHLSALTQTSLIAPPKAKKQRTKAPAKVSDDEPQELEAYKAAAVPTDDEEEDDDEDAEEEDPKDTAKTSGPASTVKGGKKRTPKEADLDEVEEEIAAAEADR